MYWISIEPRGTPFLVLYNPYEENFRKRRQPQNEISRQLQEVCATPTQLPQPAQLLKEAGNVRVCPPARGLLNGVHVSTRLPHLLDEDENEYVVNIVEDHIDHGPSSLGGPTNKQGDGLPKGPSFGPDDPIYGFTSSQRQTLVHKVGEYTFGRVMGWMDTVIPQHIETVLRRVLPEYMTQNKNLSEREKSDDTTKENSHEMTTKPTTPIVLHNECNDDRQNMSVDEREVRETYEPTIVRQIWLKHHKEGVEENIDVNIEEHLSEEDLQGLSKYVTGDLPSWGLPKPWYDYTQLVMPCHLPGHWVAVVVYLNEHTIGIFDSTQHNWTRADADARKEFMKPLARILHQMLKYCGFWEARSELVPKYTQWTIKFSRAEDTLMQQESTSCGIFALLHVEQLLTGKMHNNMSILDVKKYRSKLARLIFKFSTDARSK
ncbi:hypothetical protein C2S51_001543 [Perilla frutescens var. frutescens]|nr:hypothetical protein C2S51_001543 [Perilla frutescens var. frutescens]